MVNLDGSTAKFSPFSKSPFVSVCSWTRVVGLYFRCNICTILKHRGGGVFDVVFPKLPRDHLHL